MFRRTSSQGRRTAVVVFALAIGQVGAAGADEGGASVIHATKAQKSKASHAYKQAIEAIDAKKYDEALELLDASFNAVASPNSLLLKARALSQLERNVEAYRVLEAAILLAETLAKSDDKYAQTAESARKELAELSKKLALVTIKPAADVKLDDTSVAAGDWNRPQPYAPGKLKVSVSYPGGEASIRELELSAGGSVEVSTAPEAKESKPAEPAAAPPAALAPPPTADDAVSKRTLAYVSGAIGLVGVGTFAAFSLMNDDDDPRDGCAGGVCNEGALDTAERNAKNQTIAFVGLGVGIVGLATGAYLFVTSKSAAPQEEPATDVALGPDRVVIRTTF